MSQEVDSACRVLAVGEEIGPQVPLAARCDCSPEGRPRVLPIWIQTATADAGGRLLRGVLNPDLILFTYRCKCKRKVVITLGDIFRMNGAP